MKKTQMALAAVALVASTAAMAEVSMYGVADVNVVNKTGGTSIGGAGNSAGSILGFKGSDDLGGGLKASFLLEAGYSAATGQYANGGASTGLFNRQAYVGLGNETVELKAGFQISPFITAALTGAGGLGGNGVFVPGLTRLFGDLAAIDGTGNATSTGVDAGGFFVPDALNLSINTGGATVNLMNRVQASTGDAYYAGSLTSSMGGVNLALAGQNRKGTTNATNYVLAGNTNVGDVTLSGAWSKNSGDFTGNGLTVGASTPIAGALSGGIQYFKAADSASGNQTSVSLKYTLSKATYGYLNYSQFSVASSGILAANDNGNFNTGDAATKRLIALGVAHSF
jgi:predicted porin